MSGRQGSWEVAGYLSPRTCACVWVGVADRQGSATRWERAMISLSAALGFLSLTAAKCRLKKGVRAGGGGKWRLIAPIMRRPSSPIATQSARPWQRPSKREI